MNYSSVNTQNSFHAAKGGFDSHGTNNPNLGDILSLAFLYILQAVNGMQTTAQLQSKQMQSNANAQARVNNEEASIGYVNVSSYKEDFKTIRTKHQPKCNADRGVRPAGPNKESYDFSHSYYTTQKVFKSDNHVQIQQQMVSNNQNNKMRDDLSSQIVVLRQDAQTKMTQLNSEIDLAQQDCQEGIMVTSTLKQLMREALLRS